MGELLKLFYRKGVLLGTFLRGLGSVGLLFTFELASRAKPAFACVDFVAVLALLALALVDRVLGIATLPLGISTAETTTVSSSAPESTR